MLMKFDLDNRNASSKLKELKKGLRDIKRYADDNLPEVELEIDPLAARSVFLETDMQKQERIMKLQKQVY